MQIYVLSKVWPGNSLHAMPTTEEKVCKSSAIFYKTDADASCELPMPIEDIECNHACPPGKYLDIDYSNQNYAQCKPCIGDTISTGSSLIYSDSKSNMDQFLKESLLSCSLYDSIEWNYRNCKNWHYNTDSRQIDTGDCAYNVNCTSKLDHFFNFLNDGDLEISMQYDTMIDDDGNKNGRVRIYANYQIAYEGSNSTHEYIKVSIPLKKGVNAVSIEYNKYNTNQTKSFRARIKHIQVDGMYGPYYCSQCPEQSFANKEKTICQACPKSHYFNEKGECIPCPENTTSYPGSHGISECVPLLPCNSSQMIASYSKCIYDVVTITYEWNTSSSQLCSRSELISPHQIKCEQCLPGQYRVQTGKVSDCALCEEGEYKFNIEPVIAQDAQNARKGSSAIIKYPFLHLTTLLLIIAVSTSLRLMGGKLMTPTNSFQ